MANRTYISIDLKSFYASVECADRMLDPLTTNLVVADISRTEKTICLAVSPSLKAYGIPGRARLFEVVQKVKEINIRRLDKCSKRGFTGKSFSAPDLKEHSDLEFDYIIAPPQMGRYMQVSSQIYGIYLKYIAPEDIHVYSIDEVFIDATDYLSTYKTTARNLAMMLIGEVLKATGITATAGIGTNLYLCKIAMDIEAKRSPPDKDGVRIAELDETAYRRKLWNHRPLTDFWRIGRGYARKLEDNGLYTMGDVAMCSVQCEDLLYGLFGKNAELLIDHAWGWEPCTISAIKAYRPESNSISSGQVLQYPYDFSKGRIIVREMTDLLVLDLVDKKVLTDQLVLNVGYDAESLGRMTGDYSGAVTSDFYGRKIPKAAHGSVNMGAPTSSSKRITDAVIDLYERITDSRLLVRRITVTANHIVYENSIEDKAEPLQLDIFSDYEVFDAMKAKEAAFLRQERKIQEAVISIKKKYGKNAILKGTDFEEGATAIERNRQIGGHRAWSDGRAEARRKYQARSS